MSRNPDGTLRVQALLLAACSKPLAEAEAVTKGAAIKGAATHAASGLEPAASITSVALLQPMAALLHQVEARSPQLDVLSFRRALSCSHPLHAALDTLRPLLTRLFHHACDHFGNGLGSAPLVPPMEALPEYHARLSAARRARGTGCSPSPLCGGSGGSGGGSGGGGGGGSSGGGGGGSGGGSGGNGQRKGAMSLPILLSVLRAAGLLRQRGEASKGEAPSGVRLSERDVHEAFWSSLPALSLEEPDLQLDDFAEVLARVSLRVARLAAHAKLRHGRHAATAEPGTEEAYAACAASPDGTDRDGEGSPRHLPLRTAPHDAVAGGAWEEEAAIVSALPTVVAKLLVCTEDPSASIVGSIAAEGLSATAFIGRALLELSTVKV